MTEQAPQTIYLADYAPPAFLIDTVDLTFRLDPKATRVLSRIAFRPNPEATTHEFFLHGEELRLISAQIDGVSVTPEVTDAGLICHVPDAPFVWEAEVEIDPAGNTALEGLYMSNGMYCTQCEAEGFRKISYYPDRPDVMAVFTVTIESDLPVMLSNGNAVSPGVWHDPWPKPAYLFALVAGDLVAHADTFTTRSGRTVDLNIWVRKPDLGKCAFGMAALKLSMDWDERVYGREYDLDIFNIVAVDDFNMGAMENKGLNIFNSSCVLASPETASDADFERIEAIIAHEYFHNWTGNRITCRDWFQLCLKEGLTVFRDQQFTGDVRGHAVKRIDDAAGLRSYQFREDAGPLAHAVRPESFVEINNFYTSTVYEKGAEVIGMLKTLIGDQAYYKGCDLYFTRHDGQACTIEDWLACFAEVSGRDLGQFKRWYSQAGTPSVAVEESFDAGTYALTLTQATPPTPGQPDKAPLVIPVAVGLLSPDGAEVVPTTLLELTQAQQTFTFDGLAARPVPSILRNFSAPVTIRRDQSAAERAFLLAHDTDPFNRWDAARLLARDTLIGMVADGTGPAQDYLEGVAAVLRDDTLDPDFRAAVLALPTEDDIAVALFEAGQTPEPQDIRIARDGLKLHITQHNQDLLTRLYAQMQVHEPYSADVGQVAKRVLGNAAMVFISQLDGGRLAAQQYASAGNMTQQSAALATLLGIGKGRVEVGDFETQWREDRLVMDKWFRMQPALAAPDQAAATADRLTRHPAFDMKNPNRFRAVFGGLAGNAAGFHHSSGDSYALIADWLIRLDAINPQTTARMCTVFETWRRYGPERQAMMQAALRQIGAAPGLSGDTTEIVTRLLNG